MALLQALRDASEALPGCAWLVSPWTDLTLSRATLVTNDGIDPLIHRGYLAELAAAYVPAGVDPRILGSRAGAFVRRHLQSPF